MARTATDAALVRVGEERQKRRKLGSPDFEPIGNPSLEERASRAKMDVEYVAPSSSKDHIGRDRPVEPEEEEEERKKGRIADSTGQKRKESVTETSHTRAKAKAADPVGVK